MIKFILFDSPNFSSISAKGSCIKYVLFEHNCPSQLKITKTYTSVEFLLPLSVE